MVSLQKWMAATWPAANTGLSPCQMVVPAALLSRLTRAESETERGNEVAVGDWAAPLAHTVGPIPGYSLRILTSPGGPRN